nr:uncharacterized protein LOC109747328 [Aegilops tauschii subsp. strangulata]
MSSTGPSNPFASTFGSNSEVPNATHIRGVPLFDHVPIKLSHKESNYYVWKTYVNLLLREYNLHDHVDGTTELLVVCHDSNWMAIDATIIRWFFLTVSPDIFHTVVRDGDDSYTVWTKINAGVLWVPSKRLHHLDAYYLCLKTLSDDLNDIGFKVGDELLSTLTAGLSEEFGNNSALGHTGGYYLYYIRRRQIWAFILFL